MYDLCHGGVFFQISNPFFADINALSTSFDVALDALPITSSLAGLITSYDPLSDEGDHFPSINCPYFSYLSL